MASWIEELLELRKEAENQAIIELSNEFNLDIKKLLEGKREQRSAPIQRNEVISSERAVTE